MQVVTVVVAAVAKALIPMTRVSVLAITWTKLLTTFTTPLSKLTIALASGEVAAAGVAGAGVAAIGVTGVGVTGVEVVDVEEIGVVAVEPTGGRPKQFPKLPNKESSRERGRSEKL